MGYITKHLYVTKAQQAKLCQGPETSFQVSSADCLSVWGGPASLSLIANILGFFSDPMCKTTFSWMCHLPATELSPQHRQHLSSRQKPERLYLGFFSCFFVFVCAFPPNARAQAPDCTLACSGEHYQPPGSGLRVEVGVLLVFSSLAEMYSLTITMLADQRQREVLSAAGCAVTLSTSLVGWPQGELGWERVLQRQMSGCGLVWDGDLRAQALSLPFA